MKSQFSEPRTAAGWIARSKRPWAAPCDVIVMAAGATARVGALVALNLIGQLACPRCVVDSHRVAGEVDFLANRLDQRDVKKLMLHAVTLTTDDSPAILSATHNDAKAVGRKGRPLHNLPSRLMIDCSVRIQTLPTGRRGLGRLVKDAPKLLFEVGRHSVATRLGFERIEQSGRVAADRVIA
jgi:hypothetical protein